MSGATEHACSVLAHAIHDIDNMLGNDGCALEYPFLVTAYCQIVAGSYQALTLSDAIEHFLTRQDELNEAFAKRHQYDH
jgi:hypothetical protein